MAEVTKNHEPDNLSANEFHVIRYFRDRQAHEAQERLPAHGSVDDGGHWLRVVHLPISRNRGMWTGRDRIGGLRPLSRKYMSFDVHKHFRVEGHAHEMEIAIKAAHLEGILVQRSAARPVGRPTPFWYRR